MSLPSSSGLTKRLLGKVWALNFILPHLLIIFSLFRPSNFQVLTFNLLGVLGKKFIDVYLMPGGGMVWE